MGENFRLCGIISNEDLHEYAYMTVCLETDSDISELVNMLSNYGKDVREIQKTVEQHLSECFLCKEAYEHHLEVCLKSYIISETIRRSDPRIQKLVQKRKPWNFEHFNHPDSKGLRSYLFKKAMAEVNGKEFQQNKEFEEHIQGCNYCQDFYGSEIESIKILNSLKREE
ncbi:MAG: hypothetical protein JW924_02805 [Fusobacteriaceae bacterium]|nr:hypothetical protein [Fusobacteriaceae bacterium]